MREEDPTAPAEDILPHLRSKVRSVRGRISSDAKRLIEGRYGKNPDGGLTEEGRYHTSDDERPFAAPLFHSTIRSVPVLRQKAGRLTISDVGMLHLACEAALQGRTLREGPDGIRDFNDHWMVRGFFFSVCCLQCCV